MSTLMRHLIKPITRTKNQIELVIKTAFKPKGPNLPSKRPFGTVYQVVKKGLQYSGYYDRYNLRRYDPDYLYEKYAKKYTYKPRKRVAGYLGQKLHEKKTRKLSSKRSYFYQKPVSFRWWNDWYKTRYSNSKSSYRTLSYRRKRRKSRVYYQGNMVIN